ncbi:MAG: hypothetical protein QF473_33900, partial [Planctomycetota bacterium]|nr:hypothetical protein [Planctomycetota bacterium]
FGFGVGFTVGYAGKASKCRSRPFMTVAGLVAGILALYSGWVFFEFALLNRYGSVSIPASSLPDMFLSPVALWKTAETINANGWYSIRGTTPSGIVLWIFWAIEAVLVVGMAAVLAPAAIDEEVFCEQCFDWCDSSDLPVYLGLTADEGVIERLPEGEIEDLESLPTVTDVTFPRVTVKIRKCLTCSNTTTCQLVVENVELDKEGEAQLEAAEISGQLLISDEEFARLKRLSERPAEEPDPQEETESAEEQGEMEEEEG